MSAPASITLHIRLGDANANHLITYRARTSAPACLKSFRPSIITPSNSNFADRARQAVTALWKDAFSASEVFSGK